MLPVCVSGCKLWVEEPLCNTKLSWSYAKAHLPGCYQELNYSIKLLPLRLSVHFHLFPLFSLFLHSSSVCCPTLLKLCIHLYLCLPHSHHSSFFHFLAFAGFAEMPSGTAVFLSSSGERGLNVFELFLTSSFKVDEHQNNACLC